MGNKTSYIHNMEFELIWKYLIPKITLESLIDSSWNEPTLQFVGRHFFVFFKI